ncbi:MAG TPA: S41 family peptidase [Mobilitalea sp.]|nr:S41 family peptidase [Mobilitalea sp.]
MNKVKEALFMLEIMLNNGMVFRDLILLLLILVCIIAMAVIRKKRKQEGGVKYIFFIPVIFCLLHVLIFGFNALLLLVYTAAIIMALLFLLRRKKLTYRLLCTLVIILCTLTFGISCFLRNNISLGYVAAFEHTLSDMESDYILSKHKKIDYDVLHDKLLPLFEEAEEAQDPVAYYIAWLNYCYNFYDGHVSASPAINGEKVYNEAKERLAGNDYGLSLITLSGGNTIAILVDEKGEALAQGIHTGTVITKWNGELIENIKEDMEVVYPTTGNFPDKENEEYYKSFFIAGLGGETADITFISEDGIEKNITVQSMGSYTARLDKALSGFQYEKGIKDNLYWDVQEDGHGYLYVYEEMWEGDNDNYDGVREIVADMITKMKAEGVKDLVIDLRNNQGGDDIMGMVIASFFATKDFYYFGDGRIKNDGTYSIIREHNLVANPTWTDIPIAVLVNSNTVSAGDGLAYNLNKLDQVTLMGLSGSCSSFQAVGGMTINSSAYILVSFPIIYQLNEDESIMIDTDENRNSVIDRDIVIPITDEAANMIYEEEIDYELEYAKNYLEGIR